MSRHALILNPTDHPPCHCGGMLRDLGFDRRFNSNSFKCIACGNLVRVPAPETPIRDPEDPKRYLTGPSTTDDIRRALIEQWGFNHRQTYGRKLAIPVALFNTLKASGVNMKDLRAIKPRVW